MSYNKTVQYLKSALDKVFCTQTSYYRAAKLCDLGVIAPLGSKVYQILRDKDYKGWIATYTLIGVHITNGYSTGRRRRAGDYMIVLHEPSNSVKHLKMEDLGVTIFTDYEVARRNL